MQSTIDTDLYSRQLYVLGEEAMKKMNESDILVSGMSGLGVEIAKNTILSGVKSVTVHDRKNVEYDDLSTNYYAQEINIGQNRARASFDQLSQLNNYVSVDMYAGELTDEFLKKFQVAVFVDRSHEETIELNKRCRELNIKSIFANTASVFGKIFVDFGKEFVVIDTDGETPKSAIIENVHIEGEKMFVKTVDNHPHDMSSDCYVKLDLKGLNLNKDTVHNIEYVDRNTFSINIKDMNMDGKFESGEFVQHKPPKMLKFESYEESFKDPKFMNDDFLHPDRNRVLHTCFKLSDSKSFENDFRQSHKDKLSEADSRMVEIFEKTRDGSLVFTNSVIGGFVAQEIMKACSGKFTPIFQYMYFESADSVPDMIDEKYEDKDTRYINTYKTFGKEFVDKLQNQNLFMVGAGAIGCELAKNFAMVGIGSKGQFIVTDMDTIEKSNLNRQFLFRREDIGKMKSKCVARAVKQMNSDIEIECHENRVGPESRDYYNDKFFKSLDFVVNALDNVEARRFMDSECVQYQKPLFESGTSGTKGNTQVVVPHITESYSDTYDPPEKDFPACTIKNFPYRFEHTVHWAKERFLTFTDPPSNVNRYLENPDCVKSMNINTLRNMYDDVKKCLVKEMCTTFDDCVYNALLMWHKDYRDQILDILNSFPENHTTEEGVKYWSGTKKCPKVLNFDVSDKLHFDYVYFVANLYADVYNVHRCYSRDKVKNIIESKLKDVPEYKKSDKKVASNDEELKEQKEESDMSFEEMLKDLPDPTEFKDVRLNPLKFEKDDDSNYHIDFITTSSNLRSTNYGIEIADRLTAKGIAGKIIPAIATTTAIVAGLVCFEICKVVNSVKNIDRYRNYFLNLAIPFMTYSEPGPTKGFTFNDKKYTNWNNFIKVDGTKTIADVLEDIAKSIKDNDKDVVDVSMLTYGESSLYMSVFSRSEKMKKRLNQPLLEVIKEVSGSDIKENPVRCAVLCTDAHDEDQTFFVDCSY